MKELIIKLAIALGFITVCQTKDEEYLNKIMRRYEFSAETGNS